MLAGEMEPGRQRILVADDQPDVLEALRLLLKGAGYASVQVSSPQEVLNAASVERFDLILLDLNYARDTATGWLDGAPGADRGCFGRLRELGLRGARHRVRAR